MECNRDEALRAKELAEQKFSKQDFVGAKKFVHKAQQLFPSLEGLAQMLPVIEVHTVAQIKVGGNETDWYGILQLEPGADDSTLKKQYRKLALLLHPDKNKAVGAEAAFKLISEAWGILSDKAKRAIHDMKRGVKPRVSHARVVMEPFQAPFSAGPPAASQNQSPGVFWTACPNCHMQYQYYRTHENHQLQCQTCKIVFVAHEIPSPAAGNGAGSYSWRPFEAQRQDVNRPAAGAAGGFGGATGPNGFANGSFPGGFPGQQSNAFFSSAAAAAAARSKVAAAAAAASAATSAVHANNSSANVASQAFHTAKRERVEAQEREKELKRKEKELKRKLREDLRKDKEEQKREKEERNKTQRTEDAMERLVAKKKENAMRNELKQKVDVKRKLKRKKRQRRDEDDEDAMVDMLEEDDVDVDDDVNSTALPRRRSGRTRKNVATYKVDDSDDSELEEFAPSKRAKSECEGEVGEEESGLRQQTTAAYDANGRKGKSVADEAGSGMNGREQFGGEGRRRVSAADERTKDDDRREDMAATNTQNSYRRDFGEPSTAFHGSRTEPHSDLGQSSPQQVETSAEQAMAGEVQADGEEAVSFKSEDFGDGKSPSAQAMTARSSIHVTRVAADNEGEKTIEGREEDRGQKSRIFPPRSSDSTIFSQGDEEAREQEGEISVPDPDFNDFDANRTEAHLAVGQIWAMYDDQDGMPRFYTRIDKISVRPFNVKTHWLEKSRKSTIDNSKWSDGSGISPPCGEFNIGSFYTFEQINCFSHIVVDKAQKTPMKIFPKKEEVWAVFRDWCADERLGPRKVPKAQGLGTTFTYEMVLILSDFTEEKGVDVATLVKIPNFKTLFCRQQGPEVIKTMNLADLQRFSHNVPNGKVDEDMGFPLGTVELDPAATPFDLMESTG